MYDTYDIVKDAQGQFRSLVPGTSMVIQRCTTKYELKKTMAAMEAAFQNGKCAGIAEEKIRIKEVLGL